MLRPLNGKATVVCCCMSDCQCVNAGYQLCVCACVCVDACVCVCVCAHPAVLMRTLKFE